MPEVPPAPEEAPGAPGVQLLEGLARSGPPVGRRASRSGRRAEWPSRSPWAAAAALVLVSALVAGLVWFRRPAVGVEQLPMAEGAAAGAVAAPSAVGSGTGGSAVSAPPSVGTSAVPVGPVVVHVAGAVARPGVVTVPGGSRVTDALSAAGGLRPDADPDRLNLAAVLRDGERVAVPVVGQPAPAAVADGGAGRTSTGPSGASGGPSGPVDLNSASAAELEQLPGVGPSTAAAIVDHRATVGPFQTVEDLLDVRGIGDAKLEQLRAYVVVG